MKPRDVRAFLWDIENGCAMVARIVTGKSFDDYSADETMRLAVERALEIIAEAVRNAVRIDPALEARMTGVARIIAFRNRLAHQYWGVLATAVWAIVQTDVPLLRREVRALLDSAE